MIKTQLKTAFCGLCLLAMAVTGCSNRHIHNEDQPKDPVMTGFTVTSKAEVQIGDYIEIKGTAVYDNGTDKLITKDITCSGDNAAVATLSKKFGLNWRLTGVSEGKVNVTCTYAGMSGSTAVDVFARIPDSFTVAPNEVVLMKGDRQGINASAKFDGGFVNATGETEWSSANENVARVIKEGKVVFIEGVGQGETVITANYRRKTATVKVTVNVDEDAPRITSVELKDANSVILTFSEEMAESATDPANYKLVLDGSVSFDGASEALDVTSVTYLGDNKYELTIGEGMDDINYTLLVDTVDLTDTNGNELAGQAADNTFKGIDTIAPVVLDVKVQDGHTIVVTFSEQMGSGAADAGNYRVCLDEYNCVQVLSVSCDSKGVCVLSLADGMSVDSYNLVIDTEKVADDSGNKLPVESASRTIIGQDGIPPIILGTQVEDGHTVVVTYSEAMGDAASDVGNYRVCDKADSSRCVVVKDVVCDEAGQCVLGLADGMEEGVVYEVIVNKDQVVDPVGNKLLPDSSVQDIIGQDGVPPVIKDITVVDGHNVIVEYSEQMADGASDIGNYSVCQKASSSSCVDIIAIDCDAAGKCLLTLDDGMVAGEEYIVNIDKEKVTDVSGNNLSADDDVKPVNGQDGVPPVVKDTVVVDGHTIVVDYSEAMSDAATDTDNYQICKKEDSAQCVDVIVINCDADGKCTLTLADGMEEGKDYDVIIDKEAVTDGAGNKLSDKEDVKPVSGKDGIPPVIKDIIVEDGHTVVVEYSEQMGEGAADPDNYQVCQKSASDKCVTVKDVECDLNGKCTLGLDDGMEETEYYVVLIDNDKVTDDSGNKLVVDESVQNVEGKDGIPPVVKDTIIEDGHTIIVQYSEQMGDEATDVDNYTVCQKASVSDCVDVIDITCDESGKCTLKLDDGMVEGEKYDVVIDKDKVADDSGNNLSVDTEALTVEGQDGIAPVIENVTVDDGHHITVQFDEPMGDGASDVDSYKVCNSTGECIGVDDVTCDKTGKCTITINDGMEEGADYHLVIDGDKVTDDSGNHLVTKEDDNPISGKDGIPPTVVKIEVTDGHTVVITYSERMAANATDTDNYRLCVKNDAANCVTVIKIECDLNGLCTLTLDDGMVENAGYELLITKEQVTDVAGNQLVIGESASEIKGKDGVRPTVEDTSLEDGHTIVVEYSEEMGDSATDPHNYHVCAKEDKDDCVDVVEVECHDDGLCTLTLDDGMKDGTDYEVTIDDDKVTDKAGNKVITEEETTPISGKDGIPPVVENAELIDGHNMVITYSEQMAENASSVANYSICASVVNHCIDVKAVNCDNSGKCTVTFDDGMEPDKEYDLTINNLQVTDVAGNKLAGENVIKKLAGEDGVLPTAVGAVVNDGHTVVVTYSEKMGSGAALAGSYGLCQAGGSCVTVNSVSCDINGKCTLKLADGMIESASYTLTIDKEAVKDSAGNTLDGVNTFSLTGQDGILPVISSVAISDGHKAVVTYSEKMNSAAGLAASYKVCDGAGNCLTVNGVSCDEGVCTLALADGMVEGTTYTISVTSNKVADVAGNILSGSTSGTALGKDGVAPTVKNIVLDSAHGITVTYSEPMASNAADKDNYSVCAGGNCVAITAVSCNSGVCTLTLGDGMVAGTSYTVAIAKDNMGDVAGNKLSAANTSVTVTGLDGVRPTINSVTIANGHTVTVTYSEKMGESAAVSGNYTVCSGSSCVTVNTVSCNSGVCTLALADGMVAGTTYTVTVTAANLSDESGNKLDGTSAYSITGMDGVLPVISSVAISDGHTVIVTYSEKMNSEAGLASSYKVCDGAGNCLTVNGVSCDEGVCTLALADGMVEGTTYTISVTSNKVADVAGNILSGSTSGTALGKDGVAPTVKNIVLDSAHGITVTYSEPMASNAADKDNYSVCAGGNCVAITAVSCNSGVCTLTLGDGMVAGTSYTVAIAKDNMGDVAGNKLSAANTSVTVTGLDGVRPGISGVEVTDGHTVVVTYTEAMSAAAKDLANYTICKGGDCLTVTAVNCTAAGVCTLTLADGMLADVNYTLTVAKDQVTDNNGNKLADEAATTAIVGKDGTRPTVVSVEVTDGHTITVTYSEAMAANAQTVGNYSVCQSADDCLTITGVSCDAAGLCALSLADGMVVGDYTFTIKNNNVTDIAQNKLADSAAGVSGYSITIIGKDDTKPTLVSAVVVDDHKVKVAYSEAMGASAAVAANYTICKKDVPASCLTVTGVTAGSDNTYILALGDGMEIATYLLTASSANIKDASGVVLDAASAQRELIGQDKTRPTVKNIVVTDGHKITITYSEKMAENASSKFYYSICAKDNAANCLSITEIKCDEAGVCAISFGDGMTTGEYLLKITATEITDVAWNVLDLSSYDSTGNGVVITGKDDTAPEVVGASATDGYTISVQYSEKMGAAARNGANYTVCQKSASANCKQVSSVSCDDATFKCALTVSGMDAVTYVVTVSSAVKDVANNALNSAKTTAEFVGIDVIAPTVNDVEVTDGHTVVVTYSERMAENAATSSNYAVCAVADSSQCVAVTTISCSAAGVCTIALGDGMQNVQYNFTIISANVTDVSGNQLANSGSGNYSIEISGQDDTPPRISNLQLQNNSELLLTFSEPVAADGANKDYFKAVYELPKDCADGQSLFDCIAEDAKTLTITDVTVNDDSSFIIGLASGMEDVTYYLVIDSDNIQDEAGLALVDQSHSFEGNDTVPPIVAAASSYGSDQIKVTFSKEMDPDSISTSSFKVVRGDMSGSCDDGSNFTNSAATTDFAITDVECENNFCILTLSDDQEKNVSYIVIVDKNGPHDTTPAANTVGCSNNGNFLGNDRIRVVSAISSGANNLVLTFSKEADPNTAECTGGEACSNYYQLTGVSNLGDITSVVIMDGETPCGSAVEFNPSKVCVTHTGDQRGGIYNIKVANGIDGDGFDNGSYAVKDLQGNNLQAAPFDGAPFEGFGKMPETFDEGLLSVNPFSDDSDFGYLATYHGKIYIGPNSTGTHATRFNPNGSNPERITFSFDKDNVATTYKSGRTNYTSNKAANSATKHGVDNVPIPPYVTLGHTGCTANSGEMETGCGPNNENGRAVFTSGIFNGKERLFISGGRTAGYNFYLYQTDDNDTQLDFHYIDLSLPFSMNSVQGNKGSESIHIFNGNLYWMAPGDMNYRPYFIKVQTETAESMPGTDSTYMQIAGAPGFAYSTNTNKNFADYVGGTIYGFNDRLYLANSGAITNDKTNCTYGSSYSNKCKQIGGILRSNSNNPGGCGSNTGCSSFTDISPKDNPDYYKYFTSALTKAADLIPADQPIPAMTDYKGNLYMIRNACTTNTVNRTADSNYNKVTHDDVPCPSGNEVPQIWKCEVGTDGICAAAEWKLVAQNGTTGRSNMGRSANNKVTLLIVNGDYLYVGYDNPNGVEIWRTNVSNPANESDFEQVPVAGLNGEEGDKDEITQLFSAASLQQGIYYYLYLSAGKGGTPVKVYRQQNY